MTRRTTVIALTLVATMSAGLIGAAVAVLATNPFAPTSVASAVTATEMGVTAEPFRDPREVQVILEQGPPRSMTAPGGGRVTRWDCFVGAAIPSGSSPLDIDGIPKLALAMSVPPWRDLEWGVRGADVDALQSALVAAGRPAPQSGVIDRGTMFAFVDALRGVGSRVEVWGRVPISEILWIPDASAPVASCGAGVGQDVQGGDEIASFTPPLVGARIASTPEHATEGARELAVDESTIPIDASGLIAPEHLPVLAATAAYGRALGDEAGKPFLVTYRLVEPVAVAVVPPSALLGATGSQCVIAEGKPEAVTVVGSQFGKSYVVFGRATPSSVQIDAPPGATCD